MNRFYSFYNRLIHSTTSSLVAVMLTMLFISACATNLTRNYVDYNHNLSKDQALAYLQKIYPRLGINESGFDYQMQVIDGEWNSDIHTNGRSSSWIHHWSSHNEMRYVAFVDVYKIQISPTNYGAKHIELFNSTGYLLWQIDCFIKPIKDVLSSFLVLCPNVK